MPKSQLTEWNESMAEIPEFRLKTQDEMRVRNGDRATPAQRNRTTLRLRKLTLKIEIVKAKTELRRVSEHLETLRKQYDSLR